MKKDKSALNTRTHTTKLFLKTFLFNVNQPLKPTQCLIITSRWGQCNIKKILHE